MRSVALGVVVAGALAGLLSGVAEAKPSNPAFLGISMSDMGGPGNGPCMVTKVTPDTGAALAGVRDGDMIVALDGAPIVNCDALVSTIQTRQPNDHVRIDVRRSERNGLVALDAQLAPRDEVLRRRGIVGQPVRATQLFRVDDTASPVMVDLSTAARARTTIVGWFPAQTCVGCDAVFQRVNRWSRARSTTVNPTVVVGATSGSPQATVEDNLKALKVYQSSLDVPLLLTDSDTVEELSFGDHDRINFMVIDCRGVVQYAAPIAPTADDLAAALDELYAAAEHAARPGRR